MYIVKSKNLAHVCLCSMRRNADREYRSCILRPAHRVVVEYDAGERGPGLFQNGKPTGYASRVLTSITLDMCKSRQNVSPLCLRLNDSISIHSEEAQL